MKATGNRNWKPHTWVFAKHCLVCRPPTSHHVQAGTVTALQLPLEGYLHLQENVSFRVGKQKAANFLLENR